MTTSDSSATETPALFSVAEVYQGDPLKPDLETPTPLEIVASLGRRDRQRRVERLVEQAHEIYEQGLAAHLDGRQVSAVCLLFSGGNDSTVLGHLFRSTATHAVHANTTIGIEQTRQFVRDTCQDWGLPLIEVFPPETYEQLVLDRGFPGPGMHWKMYARLKERALDHARHQLGFANSRKRAGIFIAGRRRQESERRADIPLHEADGSVIWVSPLALWTKLDMGTYRLMHRELDPVPINEVSELLHMSGECLCGSYAKPHELDEIRYWFPEVAAEIDELEKKVTAAGHEAPFNMWGHGQGDPSKKKGRLCSSCAFPAANQLSLDDERAA